MSASALSFSGERRARPVSSRIPSPVRVEKSPARSLEGFSAKAVSNRSCFTKPTVRLDGGGRVRKNSIQGSGASASESEDDGKRSCISTNHVKNDSCSVQSSKDNVNITGNTNKCQTGQKRKLVVSESARKLAEAKREFFLKHDNKAPDKSKLTMYDLIYYNPISNPMKPKATNSKPVTRKISVCSSIENEGEQNIEEPTEMPVPQVKVGPNGQLIIDEQSLVIDQYKVQENIDRSGIIVDEDTNGNGFYKRRQKSKDWNKWETVKFYKALNTYGTDFLLMQSIFPNRTRQELKLKYKKEEKINITLVEKALQYQEFDTEALQKDLECVEENQKRETEGKKVKRKAPAHLPKGPRRRCKMVNNSISENALSSKLDGGSCEDQSSDENVRITITRRVKKRRYKRIKLGKNKKDTKKNVKTVAPQPRQSVGTRTRRKQQLDPRPLF